MRNESRYEQARRNPTGVYDCPRAVIEDEALDAQQKLDILRTWENEAAHLQESEAGGLEGGEPSLLREIKQAIRELSVR